MVTDPQTRARYLLAYLCTNHVEVGMCIKSDIVPMGPCLYACALPSVVTLSRAGLIQRHTQVFP